MNDVTDYPEEDRQAVATELRLQSARLSRAYQENGDGHVLRRADILEHLAREVEPDDTR